MIGELKTLLVPTVSKIKLFFILFFVITLFLLLFPLDPGILFITEASTGLTKEEFITISQVSQLCRDIRNESYCSKADFYIFGEKLIGQDGIPDCKWVRDVCLSQLAVGAAIKTTPNLAGITLFSFGLYLLSAFIISKRK